MARINVFGGRTIGRPLGQCNGFAGPQRLTCDMKPRLSIAFCVLCAVLVACDATAPSRTTSNLSGQWTGTTGQGTPIQFSVSQEQRVTATTIEYAFNGCTGSKGFSDLHLEIVPGASGRSPLHGCHYESSASGTQDRTEIGGYFSTPTSAHGSVFFLGFSSCGVGGGAWVATKR